MADKHAPEVSRSLHQWGVGYRADPTAKYATAEAPGRADMLAAKGGRSAYIEIKSGDQGFNFNELRENQRKWIEEQAMKVEKMPVWIWLFLGIHPPNRDPNNYMPRRAWLVPYELFLDVENRIKPFQTTLPYRASKGYRIEMQAGLDATHLLKPFALQWNQGFWIVPQNHPFDLHTVRPLREGDLPWITASPS